MGYHRLTSLSYNFYGGPVEQTIAELTMPNITATNRLDAKVQSTYGQQSNPSAPAQSVNEETLARIHKMYGFDKPVLVRYWDLIRAYSIFDLGKSYYRNTHVVSIIVEKLPVSMSLGIWSTLLLYCISIPLGIRKATHHGTRFDSISTNLLLLGNAMPTFLFAIIMIILFASGEYFNILPLRGLVSDHFDLLPWYQNHGLSLASCATDHIDRHRRLRNTNTADKNSFLDEIHKVYVTAARLKGLIMIKCSIGIFRNALLIIIASMQAQSSRCFSQDLCLSKSYSHWTDLDCYLYEATIQRDYPVVFGTLYLFSLLGLLVNLISDITYRLVDPRINFSRQMV